MDLNKLRHLLKKEEGSKLDFKAQLNLDTDGEKRELTRDVIAMANSIGGRGYIIFGVEDKSKKIIGVDSQVFVEERIQQIIYNRCDPPIPIELDFYTLEGKSIVVMIIYKSIHKPHQMIQNGSFYVRRGSTTDTARRAEIANMFQENGLITYETIVLSKAKLDDLNKESILMYFQNLGVKSEKPSDILLEAMGIIGKLEYSDEYRPTIGGMLLFGNNPSIYLPHAYVKVAKGKKQKIFTGSIIKILDDVTSYIEQIITDENYPIDAIKESIANALVHRDYIDSSRGISVFINYKTIEVSNPGALVARNGIYKLLKERNQNRRNPWLYQRLMLLDNKRRFISAGRSFNMIKKLFSNYDDVKFLNLVDENLFKVLFPRRVKKKNDYSNSMKRENKYKSKDGDK